MTAALVVVSWVVVMTSFCGSRGGRSWTNLTSGTRPASAAERGRTRVTDSRRTTTSGRVLQPGGPPDNDRGNRGGDVVGSGPGGGSRGAPHADRPIGGGVPVCGRRRGPNLSPDSRRHPRAPREG